MPAANDAQLFDLDAVERALCGVFAAQQIAAFGNRGTATKKAPYLDLSLTTEAMEGRRFLRYPDKPSQFQPLNHWIFRLTATATGERGEDQANAPQIDGHAGLVAIMRYNLQLYRLAQTLTTQLCPWHTIIEIRESGESVSMKNEDNTDITQLTFVGILAISDSAWP